ncbi:DUF1707 SHOCT-like domain-containing protein [Nocardiopsis terrae]
METRRLPADRIRASDTDRDLTVDRLAVAFSEGRLDHEEYERRVGAALSAVLVGELRSLTADLPGARVPVPRPRPHREHRSGPAPEGPLVPWEEWGEEWRWWLGVAGLLTGVWAGASLLGGEWVPYWPLVPLGIWAAVLLASAIWPSGEEPP